MEPKTNPAAVAQIKQARANKMGAFEKPKTVVRVAIPKGDVAQGSGVRIIKGERDPDDNYYEHPQGKSDYVSYGGKEHEHSEDEGPSDVRTHLRDKHGWDDGDFERVGGLGRAEHGYADMVMHYHVAEHSERKREVPDSLPSDIRDLKLSFGKSVNLHQHIALIKVSHLAQHLSERHGWDKRAAKASVEHNSSLTYTMHRNEHSGLGRVGGMAPVPDSLPSDIRDMKLGKGRGLWIRLTTPGFEGRPISLKRTKRGLAWRGR
jgi:hypothetical protein